MTISTIAVLGAGNGGLAAAADLTLRGYEVRLYSRSARTLAPVLDRGGIELIEGGKNGFAGVGLMGTDIDNAVAGADAVMLAAPASAHAELAAGLAPSLGDRQIVFLNPGHTGGSLHVASVLRRLGRTPKICETVTLTYICRSTAPAAVEIYRRTQNLRLAAFPGKHTAELARELGGLYSANVP